MKRRWVSGPGAHHWAALGCALALPTLGIGPAWMLWTGTAGWRVTRHLVWMAGLTTAVALGATLLHLLGVGLELAGCDGTEPLRMARWWAILAAAVPILLGFGHTIASIIPRPKPEAVRRRVVLPPWDPPAERPRTFYLPVAPTGPTVGL